MKRTMEGNAELLFFLSFRHVAVVVLRCFYLFYLF